MSTTATTADAALEELEQMVEIEEAGYIVVMIRHRQTYMSGIPSEPWQARWHIRKGREELPETFDSKVAALRRQASAVSPRRGRRNSGRLSRERSFCPASRVRK
jgi:hypothetical protein